MLHEVSCEIGGKTLTIETGKLAKQANGSVYVKYGNTRVLVTACGAKEAREGQDFFPLTVEYSEKYYSSGKIPGSFFRREGRPTSEATLSARLIDRPIRPLFPEGFKNEVQVVATIMSLDPACDPEVAASIGASAALSISDLPFNGPTATCKIGRVNGDIIINPAWEVFQSGESDMEILVSGTENAIMMVEGSAKEVPEAEVLQGILKAHEEIKKVITVIRQLVEKCGKPKMEFTAPQLPEDIVKEVGSIATDKLKSALTTTDKLQRYEKMDEAKKEVLEKMVPEDLKTSDPDTAAKRQKQASEAFGDLKYRLMREMILKDNVRIDGRDFKTIRPIATEVGILPNAHGSALFTRGETQVLAAVTLGTADDEAIVDSLYENTKRKFMLHYNFPPYSVGECGRMGGQSRREIGHGNLAERAIYQTSPKHDEFPYTIRIVCETLESNGSSSMGSVCSASMAMMHAGIPFQKPVAGIAMGLIKEGNDVAVLSDILGDEDHLGDMDFKVAGTETGVTAIQMDIKIEGVTREIMETALQQAHEGRKHILGEMAKSIQSPSNDLADNAPRITSITIPEDKIGAVIGPGGKMIKQITADTGCKIEITDDGTVNIASSDGESTKKAIEMIELITAEVEEGKTYHGTVKKIVEFGAFVEVLPGKEGLLHISELAYERVNNVEDILAEGDKLEVKVLEVDRFGKMRLSRKALMEPPEGYVPPPPSAGGGRDRGGRGGSGGRDRDRGGRDRGGDRGGRSGGGRDRGRGGPRR